MKRNGLDFLIQNDRSGQVLFKHSPEEHATGRNTGNSAETVRVHRDDFFRVLESCFSTKQKISRSAERPFLFMKKGL
jgi:hypothetical protein